MIRVFRLSYPYSKAERMSRAKLGENAVKSSLGVHRLIEDLCLKLSILGKNSRNNSRKLYVTNPAFSFDIWWLRIIVKDHVI